MPLIAQGFRLLILICSSNLAQIEESGNIAYMPKTGTANIIRNHQQFEKIFHTKNDFLRLVLAVRQEMNLSNDNYKLINWMDDFKHTTTANKSLKKSEARKKDIYGKRISFLENLSPEKVDILLNTIYKILDKYDLGNEWLISMCDFILFGFMRPPTHNFLISVNHDELNLKIEINSRTTKQDILNGWEDIKNEQHKLFGSKKRKRISKIHTENIELFKKDQFLRDIDPDLTDLDIVGRLSPEMEDSPITEDIKKRSKLRVIRHRLKG